MFAPRLFIFFVLLASIFHSPFPIPTSYAFSLTDDNGHVLEISAPPRRIISLAPGITEILFDLGLGERVVGITDYCNYPPEALAKPRVGGLQPNLEKIISLKPDLILGSTGLYQAQNTVQFTRFNIPYFLVDAPTLENIFGAILRIGTISGIEMKALEKVRILRQRRDIVRRAAAEAAHPRVLYVVDREPLISVGQGSYINELVADAGGINIASDLQKAYPVISMEYVIQRDPQVIILAMDADQDLTPAQKEYWGRWPILSAVRDGRIYKVQRDRINRPGPRVIDGLEELAGLLHPNRPGGGAP